MTTFAACANTARFSGYLFTGKERDAESGNDYFGARYYASTMGRWLSPDPKMISKQRMFDPQQWNMYSYVRNNPLIAFDPDGKELKLIIVNSSKYSDSTMRNVGQRIAASLTKAGVLNVSVEVSHHPFLSKAESLLSAHTHSIEYGPDGGSVGVKENGGKDASGTTLSNPLLPGHGYSGVDTSVTGADEEKMANVGKHETGHDAGNLDKDDAAHPTDPMNSPNSMSGNQEYTPDETQKLQNTYNRPNEKQDPPKDSPKKDQQQ
jgi:RHS repeat-associated protein